MRLRTIVILFIVSWCLVAIAAPTVAITSEPDAAGLFSETPDVLPQGENIPVAETETLPSSVLNNRIAQPASAATTDTTETTDSKSGISSTDAMVMIIAAVLLLGGAVVWMMTRHKKTA